MSETLANPSELRAVGLAIKCLAASLKSTGALDVQSYTDRLQSHIDSEYPAVQNKETLNIVLQNFIEDINRTVTPAS